MATPEIKESEFEAVACNVCGSSSGDFIFYNHDRLHGFPGKFKINCCPDCGLLYISPRPKNIGKYYIEEYEPYNLNSQDFYQKFENGLMKAYYNNQKGILAWFKIKIYQALYSPIPIEYKGRKLLDVGCGNGLFLYNLKRFGSFDVYGVDLSDFAISQAREKLSLSNVNSGSLEDQRFPDDFFDVITLNHVIEHLPDPKATLIEISRILKSKGLLIITTPNAGSWNLKVFGQHWFALETPRHLNIFSTHSLSKIVERGDIFSIKKIDYNISNYIFAKSLFFLLKIKNAALAGLLMKPKILLTPFFYLLPRTSRDVMTFYCVKK
ncbi:MAG: class I SAM-dependent methyltransferase [Patescibacteria group bacterium]